MKKILFLTVISFVLYSCNKSIENTNTYSDTEIKSSHSRMLSILDSIKNNAVYPFYLNDHYGAIADLKKIISSTTDSIQIFNYQYILADEYLRAGYVDSSITLLNGILTFIEQQNNFKTDFNVTSDEITPTSIKRTISIALFRASEEANCQSIHNETSCIIPFKKTAIHTKTDYGYRSYKILKELVIDNHKDYESIWLLNIVNSAIGNPIDSIPTGLAIDFEKYKSIYDIGLFRNIALDTKTESLGLAGGAIVEDFNNDGHLDIITCSFDLDETLKFYLNDGKGGFVNYSNKSKLGEIMGGLNMTHCDYNNDGFADVFIMRGGWFEGYGNYPNSLLKNNGDGTFSDVTILSNLLSYHPTHSVVWADFNNDGLIDLFIGNETSNPNDLHPSQLYLNTKSGTFVEASQEAGLDFSLFVKGATPIDYDNDGKMDLYMSCFNEKNRLFRNLGNNINNTPTFEDVTDKSKTSIPLNSFSCLTADINNDGWEDLLVFSYDINYTAKNIAAEYLGHKTSENHPILFLNNRDGTFFNATKDFGLQRSFAVMGLGIGDIDNDGFLDIYLGTGAPSFSDLYPNILLRNSGNKFEDITNQTHTGHLQKGHQISISDINNDGFNDIYMNIGGFFKSDFSQNAFFENPGNQNKFIKLKLEGKISNKNSIGARIEIKVNENGRIRNIYKTVSIGTSFGSNTFVQHIGIGKVNKIESISIFWPTSGIKQEYFNIKANSSYLIKEGHNAIVDISKLGR